LKQRRIARRSLCGERTITPDGEGIERISGRSVAAAPGAFVRNALALCGGNSS